MRGRATVAEAIADPAISGWVEEFWDEACRNLPEADLDLPEYRAALRSRFENSSIKHLLAQIGQDGVMKLRVRAVPVLRAERAAGHDGAGAIRAIGAWVAVARAGDLPVDREADAIAAAAAGAGENAVRALVRVLDPALADDAGIVRAVAEAADEVSRA